MCVGQHALTALATTVFPLPSPEAGRQFRSSVFTSQGYHKMPSRLIRSALTSTTCIASAVAIAVFGFPLDVQGVVMPTATNVTGTRIPAPRHTWASRGRRDRHHCTDGCRCTRFHGCPGLPALHSRLQGSVFGRTPGLVICYMKALLGAAVPCSDKGPHCALVGTSRALDTPLVRHSAARIR